MEGRDSASSILSSPNSFSLLLQKAGGGAGGPIHTPRAMRPTSEELHFSQQHNGVTQTPHTNTHSNPSTITSSSVDHSMVKKKKRGRPRKYAPNGTPLSHENPIVVASPPQSPASSTPLSKQNKNTMVSPSAKKQQLLALGKAGAGFTPHIITIAAGQDVATRIMSFSQQGPRGICILSANGAISNVTLGQASTSGGMVTYEGRFEILSLTGSFLPIENAGIISRTGGLSVSLAGPDGRVVGGVVAGLLMAASPVQVVVGSFISNDIKTCFTSKDEFEGCDGADMDCPQGMNLNSTASLVWQDSEKPPPPSSSAVYHNPHHHHHHQAYENMMMTSFPTMAWQDPEVKLDSRMTDINICLPGG